MKNRTLLPLLALALAAGPLMAQSPHRHAPHAMDRSDFVYHGLQDSTLTKRLSSKKQMSVTLGLPLRNTEELKALRAELHDPASPRYHQWLTNEEFTERFGPTEADYKRVQHWLQAKGLEVSHTTSNRMMVRAKGRVSDIEGAFNLQMNEYKHSSGRTFRSPDRTPTVDLDVPLATIHGLNDLVKPVSRAHKGQAVPRLGTGTSGSYLGNDLRAAYAAGVPSSIDGSGQGIALFELSAYWHNDPVNYWQDAALRAPKVVDVIVADGPANGDGEIEVSLDIEVAGAVAPGATIYVYEGDDPNLIFNQIITDGKCKSVDVSWGWATNSMTNNLSIDPTQDAIFAQMDAMGIAVLVAAGDSGTWTDTQWTDSVYSGLFNPINPADHPGVTSVGGTVLSTASAGGPWSGETAWTEGGSGYSHRYAMPSYQSSAGINWMGVNGASSTQRNASDVAAIADNVYTTAGNGQAFGESGTSIAAPLWAAYVALANQAAQQASKPPIGYINPLLYQIGASSSRTTAFHDVTTGNDGLNTGVGYDLPTGWGTPVGMTTVNALSGNNTTVAVALTTTSTALTTGGTRQFTATVTGSSINTNVTWSCTGGSVNAAGRYTAPAAPGTYTVTARSVADTSKSASTTVTVSAPTTVAVSLSPNPATVYQDGTIPFTANVTGNANEGVTWSCTGGIMRSNGFWVAPNAVGSYTVTATSVADPSKSATEVVTVTTRPEVGVAISPQNPTVYAGDTVTFTGTATNTPYTQVFWDNLGGEIFSTSSTTATYYADTEAGSCEIGCMSGADLTKRAVTHVTVLSNPNAAISISPTTVNLAPGGTCQFTGTVTGTNYKGIAWRSEYGSLMDSGFFTAPTTPGTYLVAARAGANESKAAYATVIVGNKNNVAVAVNPRDTPGDFMGTTRQYSAKVAGTTNTAVTWSCNVGSISPTGLYTTPNDPALDGSDAMITATSVADPTKSCTASTNLVYRHPQVAISPGNATIAPGATQQFTATVLYTPNTAVIWSCNGGTVNSNGLFTAPSTPGAYTVTATSQATMGQSYPPRFASSTVIVGQAPVSVSLNPEGFGLSVNETRHLVATVTGSSNTAVTWRVLGGGTVTNNGDYTAPNTPGKYAVIATSVADPTKFATAAAYVNPAGTVSVAISPANTSVPQGGQIQFSAAVHGTTNTAVTWRSIGEGSVTSSGLYTAPNKPGSGLVVATSVADPNFAAAATITVTSAGTVSVAISPTSQTLAPGASAQFTSTVTGSSNTSVNWSCSGGSVNGSGYYTAPSTAGTYTVTATSVADPSKSATATVTVSAISVGITPTTKSLTPGASAQFSATVTGTTNTAVTWTCSGGTVSNTGYYTAPSTQGTYTVKATSVADPTKSATATVTVSAVSVAISPTTKTVAPGATAQFSATVTGSTNTAVNWTCSSGTVSNTGLYTAPSTQGTYTVTATSVADPSKSATATVTVQVVSGVSVTISPNTTQNLGLGSMEYFGAMVTGTPNTAVTWSCTGGSIVLDSGYGLYTAPNTPGTYTVKATSVADPSKSASVTVIVN